MKARKIILLLLFPLSLFAQTVTYVTAIPGRLGHVAVLPAGYSDTTKRWATIIFLHGSGERGAGTTADLPKTIKNGPAKYLKDGKFLILCPQTNLWSWRAKTQNDANEFTKWAIRTYRVDPSRVYITGLSMGGEGTWFALADDPTLYAAGAPVCGRASRTEGGTVAAGGVPVWVFHGSADTSIPLEAEWNAIAGMRSVNKSLIDVTVYPRMGHDVWAKTYADPALYTWFLKWKK